MKLKNSKEILENSISKVTDEELKVLIALCEKIENNGGKLTPPEWDIWDGLAVAIADPFEELTPDDLENPDSWDSLYAELDFNKEKPLAGIVKEHGLSDDWIKVARTIDKVGW